MATTFNSLAEFKRNLKVGKKLHAINHVTFAGREEDGRVIYKDQDLGVRPISIVQSNSFACKTVKSDGTEVDSWCGYPKASECIVTGNKLVILEEDGRHPKREDQGQIPVLTYEFVD